jgi:hypothetical protein
MKKIKLPFIILVILFSACKQQTEKQPVDLEAEKAALIALIDKFEAVTNTDTLATFLTEDALVTGTAPSELFNKKQMVEMWTQYYSSIVPEHSYMGKRTVKVAADGNSATVIEEYIMPVMSPVLPARNTLHLVRINAKWMIDFISICFIPENEDIPKINKVLSE